MAYTSTTQKNANINPLKFGEAMVVVELVAGGATAATAYTFEVPFAEAPDLLSCTAVGTGTLPAVTVLTASAVTVSTAAAGTVTVLVQGKVPN